jgi:hypothetical protein
LHAELAGDPDLDGVLVEHERPRDQIVGRSARRRDQRGSEDHRSPRGSHARTLARALAFAVALAGCHVDISDVDGAFYNGDGRRVHCAINLDTSANNRAASIDSGLDRARDRAEVVELYAHDPGVSMPMSRISYVLQGAIDRGLTFVTYTDFAHGEGTGPGLALSFDDTFVDDWMAMRPLLQAFHARVTFFVCRYHTLAPSQRAGLQQLAADGHDIEPHTVHHLRAPEYVENHGLNAYLHDEVDPSIEALRDDGFDVNAFAYPYGARTGELDAAIARRVPVLRSVAFSYTLADDPCPR